MLQLSKALGFKLHASHAINLMFHPHWRLKYFMYIVAACPGQECPNVNRLMRKILRPCPKHESKLKAIKVVEQRTAIFQRKLYACTEVGSLYGTPFTESQGKHLFISNDGLIRGMFAKQTLPGNI